MSDECPFCKGTELRPMAIQKATEKVHWVYCQSCGASGPHKPSEQEAADAFKVTSHVPESKRGLPFFLRSKRNG